ncbi:MAG: LpxI family protein [Phycisphaerae bacterium]
MKTSNANSEGPLGLIAGEGSFPLLVAQGAKSAGRRVVTCGLAGIASDEVRALSDAYRAVGLMRLGQWARFLRAHGVSEAIMVGRVRKKTMYAHGPVRRYLQYLPDVRTMRLYLTRLRHDKRTHKVLEAVADELASCGVTLIDSTAYTTEHLATAGVMGRITPSDRQQADMEYGWELCRLISRSDIGQAIAVQDRDVLAVEAVEGTDNMIRRVGEWSKVPGWVLIKVANAKADMRFDVPTVGVRTVENLHAAGGRVLVLEAGRTILLEKPAVLARADALKIAVVGR